MLWPTTLRISRGTHTWTIAVSIATVFVTGYLLLRVNTQTRTDKNSTLTPLTTLDLPTSTSTTSLTVVTISSTTSTSTHHPKLGSMSLLLLHCIPRQQLPYHHATRHQWWYDVSRRQERLHLHTWWLWDGYVWLWTV